MNRLLILFFGVGISFTSCDFGSRNEGSCCYALLDVLENTRHVMRLGHDRTVNIHLPFSNFDLIKIEPADVKYTFENNTLKIKPEKHSVGTYECSVHMKCLDYEWVSVVKYDVVRVNFFISNSCVNLLFLGKKNRLTLSSHTVRNLTLSKFDVNDDVEIIRVSDYEYDVTPEEEGNLRFYVLWNDSGNEIIIGTMDFIVADGSQKINDVINADCWSDFEQLIND